MKSIKKLKIEINYETLHSLIESLKTNGITEKDYKNVIFDLDYSDCYYENDLPSILAEYSEE